MYLTTVANGERVSGGSTDQQMQESCGHDNEQVMWCLKSTACMYLNMSCTVQGGGMEAGGAGILHEGQWQAMKIEHHMKQAGQRWRRIHD